MHAGGAKGPARSGDPRRPGSRNSPDTLEMARHAGFTLVEVTVVLAVLAIAASVMLPRLPDLGALRVEAAARRLADAITVGRDRAVLGARPLRLMLDLDGGRWTLGAPGSDAEVTTLPFQVHLRAVTVGAPPATVAGTVAVTFDPAGDPLPARIDLADERGHRATVVAPPGAVRAVVVRGAGW
jgi:type II secretion system protein H